MPLQERVESSTTVPLDRQGRLCDLGFGRLIVLWLLFFSF